MHLETQYPNSGAVKVYEHDAGAYSLVCSDFFDDVDATVVCRELGFEYAQTIRCSASGAMDYNIKILDLRCKGTENLVDDCSIEWESQPTCPSGLYASVSCKNLKDSEGELSNDFLHVRC